jgi:hypothetical protein
VKLQLTLTPKQINKLIQLKAEGYTDRDVGNKVKISTSSVKKYKKIHAVEIAKAKKQAEKEPHEKFLSVENNNDLRAKVEKNREMILKIIDLIASDNFTAPFVGCIEEWTKPVKLWGLADYEMEVWKHICHKPSSSCDTLGDNPLSAPQAYHCYSL